MLILAEVKKENFPSNSFTKSAEDRKSEKKKNIQKVVKGEVKTRKKPLSSRIGEVFVKEDRGTVKEYLLFDVIIPSIKDTIVDLVTNGANMIFYGETRKRGSGRGSVARTGSKISYASYYKDQDDRPSRSRSHRDDITDIDDILFETRAEAQEVLNSLNDIIEEYGSASIADFYDLCGVTEQYTDHKYGWTNVSKASIESVRGGYFILVLPKARQIE